MTENSNTPEGDAPVSEHSTTSVGAVNARRTQDVLMSAFSDLGEGGVARQVSTLLDDLKAPGANRIVNTCNEYGKTVTLYRCMSCFSTFTVCPEVDPKDDGEWLGCLGPDCGSYDPDRDGDKLFDEGRVYQRGDRSHFKVIEGGSSAASIDAGAK